MHLNLLICFNQTVRTDQSSIIDILTAEHSLILQPSKAGSTWYLLYSTLKKVCHFHQTTSVFLWGKEYKKDCYALVTLDC